MYELDSDNFTDTVYTGENFGITCPVCEGVKGEDSFTYCDYCNSYCCLDCCEMFGACYKCGR